MAGADEILPGALKEQADAVSELLAISTETSWKRRKVSGDWRKANTVLILKRAEKQDQ